jgi:hypothetical protein
MGVHVAASEVKFQLSDSLAEKVATFGETSYGATRVTLVLKNGGRIPGVSIAGSREVIKARNPRDESVLATLTASDIEDVLPEP